jgi:hypothetical protein
MRILVTGGRNYDDAEVVWDALSKIDSASSIPPGEIVLIHGGASGADRLCAAAAKELGWQTEVYHAHWDLHGKMAGPLRNAEMADSGADLCVAFPGGRGTANCVYWASKAGIPIRLVS